MVEKLSRLEFLSLPNPADRGRTMARNLYLDHVHIQELNEKYKGNYFEEHKCQSR